MDCGWRDRPQPQDYTDSKGSLSLNPGVNRTVIDAESGLPVLDGRRELRSQTEISVRGPPGIGVVLSNWLIYAELPGYRSDRLRLRSTLSMGGSHVGAIVLRPLEGFKGRVFSPTTQAAPEDAKQAIQKGLEALSRREPKYKEATRKLKKAVATYPQFLAAWWAQGDARSSLKDDAGAREASMRSIAADPIYLRPYEPLMAIAFRRKDWRALQSLGLSYLALSPGSSETPYRVAVASTNLGKLDQAERLLEAVFARGEQDQSPRAHLIMGLVHESRSELDEAVESYQAFLRVLPDGQLAEAAAGKLAELDAAQRDRP